MKIAAVSDDGVTISQHFGRAPFYVVLTVEDGKVTAREKRDKLGHAHFAGEAHEGQVHDGHTHDVPAHDGLLRQRHGFDPAAQGRHARMVDAVADCGALLARGMGAGAYESIKQAGIRPVVTDVADIGEAVEAYVAGTLTDHVEKLH